MEYRAREINKLGGVQGIFEGLKNGHFERATTDAMALFWGSQKWDPAEIKMTILVIFNSILNEKMRNFWSEKCIFQQNLSKF